MKYYTFKKKYIYYFYKIINMGNSSSNSRESKIINIYNKDFKEGTYRITEPGYYLLKENIVFDPNPDHDSMPTKEQTKSGKYKISQGHPYHLGFFAAITVEVDNVILDLNGFTIEQGVLHNLQQRFFSIIELASSPFIPNQGPADFNSNSEFKSTKFCKIINGTIGRSSHHGIHGNGMSNLIIKDLIIKDFEVAAIALNGATDTIIKNVNVIKCVDKIPVLSSYSQSRFIRTFLYKLKNEDPEAFIEYKNKIYTISQIINTLETCLEITKNCILNNHGEIAPVFRNDSLLYDGNMYGIVLTTIGVVINDFKFERSNTSVGNQRIVMENIKINNIISKPVEIVACRINDTRNVEPYGKNMISGPVGDILDVNTLIDENAKLDLTLSQLILLKYKLIKNNQNSPVLEYLKTNDRDKLLEFLKNNIVSGRDSMGHVMKGNIGLFISEGEDISLKNIEINEIKSIGNDIGNNPIIPKDYIEKKGSNAYGILTTASINVSMENIDIKNVESDNGSAFDIKIINPN